MPRGAGRARRGPAPGVRSARRRSGAALGGAALGGAALGGAGATIFPNANQQDIRQRRRRCRGSRHVTQPPSPAGL